MDVEPGREFREFNEEGQSILELLFILPLMLALAFLLIRVNSAIQEGIVDQQYARGQTLFLSGNGDNYPQRAGIITDLTQNQFNQINLGVSENPVNIDDEGSALVSASTFPILANTNAAPQDNEPQVEPVQRVNVRIRNTVTLCLPELVLPGGTPVLPPATGSFFQLSDKTVFQYCNSPISTEMNEMPST
jgi:hypothetical protein